MRFLSFVFIAGLVLPISGVRAQNLGGVGVPPTGVQVFASPGEATVQVLVLNSLGGSGVFQVGLDTRLDELLVVSGAAVQQQIRGEKRTTTVRLYREGGGARTLVYEAPLEEMLRAPGEYPNLQDGDIFTVETVVDPPTPKFTWRDGLSIVSSVSTVVLLVMRLRSGRV